MKRNITYFLFNLLIGFTAFSSYSQQMAPVKVDSLIVDKIKEDVWIPFMESYRDLDIEKFGSIYTEDVTRVSKDLNMIESKSEYMKSINAFFESLKKANYQMRISFSIETSATTGTKAYQTGYYTIGLRRNENEPFQSNGYSHFDVMLEKEKESDAWKISLDTDVRVQLTEEEFLKSGTIYKLQD